MACWRMSAGHPSVMIFLGQKGEITHSMITQVREEVSLRLNRVHERKAEKADAHARRKDRLEGRTPLDVENLMEAEVTPGWESASRMIVAEAMNIGLKTNYQKKMINQAAGRGREFTAGSAADMLLTATASHSLERAIHDWRSSSKQVNDEGNTGMKWRAKAHIADYFALVTTDEYERVPWAERLQHRACRYVRRSGAASDS